MLKRLNPYTMPLLLFMWLPGCPIVEGPGRALESGCSICPPQTDCYSELSEDGAVTVSCLPSEDEFLDVESDSAPLPADGGALGSVCMGWACPCSGDEACDSSHCVVFEGIAVCSLPCPEICLEEECADACPGNGVCAIADDESAACRPEGLKG